MTAIAHMSLASETATNRGSLGGQRQEADACSGRAQESLTELAESGNAEAMRLMAQIAKQQDDKEALRGWYERAAAQGDGSSMVALARLALEQGDQASAEEWARKATHSTDEYVWFELGQLATHRDDKREWLEKAASAGVVQAMDELGLNQWLFDDDNSAVAWRERAEAHVGSNSAVIDAAWLMSNGTYEEARAALLKILAAGDHATAFELLRDLETEHEHLEEALAWGRKAAAAGGPSAVLALAPLEFEAGNREEARRLLLQVQQFAEAQYMLGQIALDEGDPSAIAWLERAADQHHGAALVLLAEIAGEAGDTARARALWERAALEGGEHEVTLRLGHEAYLNGDREGARRWFEYAATDYVTVALHNLLVMAQQDGDTFAGTSDEVDRWRNDLEVQLELEGEEMDGVLDHPHCIRS